MCLFVRVLYARTVQLCGVGATISGNFTVSSLMVKWFSFGKYVDISIHKFRIRLSVCEIGAHQCNASAAKNTYTHTPLFRSRVKSFFSPPFYSF